MLRYIELRAFLYGKWQVTGSSPPVLDDRRNATYRPFLADRPGHSPAGAYPHPRQRGGARRAGLCRSGERADERLGIRTILAVPLMREDVPVGAILIRRTVVDPFTDKQDLAP